MAAENAAKEKEATPIVLDSLDPIFNGRYGEPFYKLDGGNRLTVPVSVLRSLGNRFVVFRDVVQHRITLYPKENWDKRSRIMSRKLREQYPDRYAALEQTLIIKNTTEVEMEILPSKNKIQLIAADVELLQFPTGDRRVTLLGKWDGIEVVPTVRLEPAEISLPDPGFMDELLYGD